MSNEKKRDFILGEISSLQIKEIERQGAKIVCPYHNDSNPSGNVNLDLEEARAPLGWFRCWSCKKSVPWDDLADTLGLRKYSNKKRTDEDYVNPSTYRNGLLNQTDDEEEDGFERDHADLEFFDLTQDEWRTIPCSFLTKIGCEFVHKKYNDNFYVFMPVLIKGELRGYVKAELEKPDKVVKKDPKTGELYSVTPPSYINAPGKWSREYGLLFYDYAVELMERKDLSTIVLCEGPRDVIRLLRFGIPAMAVLGAGNWNELKRFQLEKTGAENIIIFMDGDDAGKLATKVIYKDIKQHFNTKYMSLWKYAEPLLDKKGREILDDKGRPKMMEYDPFNCPKKFLRQVKKNLI